MTRSSFARQFVRFGSVFALAAVLGTAACTSSTAPRYPEEEEEEPDPDKDPGPNDG